MFFFDKSISRLQKYSCPDNYKCKSLITLNIPDSRGETKTDVFLQWGTLISSMEEQTKISISSLQNSLGGCNYKLEGIIPG